MSRKRRERAEDVLELEEGEELREDEEDAEVQRRLESRRRDQSARMGELYDSFIRTATPEQLDRFEHWKRSKFPRAAIRRLQTDILGSSTENSAILLAAVAKMFAGDLVEAAREQMTAAGETGPIQPTHLRQAHRRALRSGSLPSSANSGSALFWRSDCGS